MTAEELLDHFDGVRRSGTGWVARCPAHEDRHQSLSITEAEDRILLRCHAGCRTENVVREAGIKWSDLFVKDEIVATYDYTDQDGNLLYQSVRYEPKSFRQRRPDGNGGWIWNMQGVDRTLYRLPQVIQAVRDGQPVWIVEGEKDADAIVEAGGTATCNVGGAGKWSPHLSSLLAGADVVIVADNDDPGREHARKVSDGLREIARTVNVVQSNIGKDAADHLEAGFTLEEFVPLDLDIEDDEIQLSEVEMRNVDWHWKPVIQVAAFHLLAGKGGAGKGSWLARVAACMTIGVSEYSPGKPLNVIWVASEDSAEADIKPRIIAAGGDPSRVYKLNKRISLPEDIPYLERKILKIRNGARTGLLIIDPVANHIGGKETDGEGSVRNAINELNLVSDRTRCAIFGVRHVTKYSDGGVSSVLGSTAWVDSPRVVITMSKDHSDSDRRWLEVVKNNRGSVDYKKSYRVQFMDVGLRDKVPRLR